ETKEIQKLSRRHAKWVEFIESFPYIIKYKQGDGGYDSRTNLFQERGNDMNQIKLVKTQSRFYGCKKSLKWLI
ncbi:unnamed protein product, partial [Musa textilis]